MGQLLHITATVIEGQLPNSFPIINGNSVPNGRYVVTLRATDRNGSGLYFEWDLPIVIKGTTPIIAGTSVPVYPSTGTNC